jgi:hypothetical protein
MGHLMACFGKLGRVDTPMRLPRLGPSEHGSRTEYLDESLKQCPIALTLMPSTLAEVHEKQQAEYNKSIT